MQLTAATRSILRLAFAVLVLALAAAVWEVAARQSPGSLLFLGMLPGPIAGLRQLATVTGLALLGIAPLVPAASGAGAPWRVIRIIQTGVVLGFGAAIYAAARGMHGMQLGDPRPDSLPVFLAKHGGLALAFGGLIEVGRRAVFARSSGSGP